MQEAAQLSEAAWLANLGKALGARDIPGALELFVEDCYWRDFLSLTWNIKTMEGKPRHRSDARSDAGARLAEATG